MGMRSLTKGVCIKSLTMRTSGEMKLGHCDFQIRTEASELGHYPSAAYSRRGNEIKSRTFHGLPLRASIQV
jgi:hypothetical protein